MGRNLFKSSAVLAAVAAVVALCGCGSGSSGGSAAGAESTQSASQARKPPWDRPHGPGVLPGSKEFIEKADAICNRGKQAGSRAVVAALSQTEGSGKPKAQRLLAAIQVAYLPGVERQMREILALDPPEGEGWQVKAFVIALGEGIHSEKRTGIHPRFSESFKHAAELARALGVKACIYSDSGFG
jgi:hypothetical protein